jgi:hypothetical protein
MATDFSALDALYPLPHEELYRQWVLTRDSQILPREWMRRTLHGWHLSAHPDAQVCDLLAEDGTAIGWVLEPLAYLIRNRSQLPDASLTLPIGANWDSVAIERALYGRDEFGRSNGEGLEGMWVAIVLGGSARAPLRRVYLGAIHSVVYSKEHRAVAPTPNLLPDLRRNVVLSRAFDPLATNAYFTFGLTAFERVHRLLPNHYLDLDTWEAVRHWPASLEPFDSGGRGAEAIVDHSRRLLQALTERYTMFRVFLSAGRDSRAILALVRSFVESGAIDVALSTSVGRDVGSRTDFQAARRLAGIVGLPLDVRQRRPHNSDAADVMRAFVRIGESKSGPSLSAAASARGAQDLRLSLAGMAGETGRSYFWSRHRPWSRSFTAGVVTPELLASRTNSPRIAPVIEAARSWLRGIPEQVHSVPGNVLDLAYVEQRLGSWESSSRYLYPGRPRTTSPMAAAFVKR